MCNEIIAERLQRSGERPAIIWRDVTTSYRGLKRIIETARVLLVAEGIDAGAVVALVGDFSPSAIAAELALFEMCCVVVPLRLQDEARHDALCAIAEAEWMVTVDGDDSITVRPTGAHPQNSLVCSLTQARRPGLILFSSGTSSGVPKGALHDVAQLLSKFERAARPISLLAFLLFDHMGGLNTMLHALLHGGCLVTMPEHSPDVAGVMIEKHRVELLPTSPTFLNLFLLSRADERYDMSSLRVISYGSEPMSEFILKTLRARLPQVKLHQTYGMTELGVLVCESRSSDSLWMKLDRDRCDYRVRDGMLELRTKTAMLGYLNAPSPFTSDGWLITRDAVDVDGEWFRVLARRSELITVGGLKVVPIEVESVLEGLEGVEEVVVSAEPSSLLGNIVCATVRLSSEEALDDFRRRLRRHCRERLPRYMIPQKISLADHSLRSERHKKYRSSCVDPQSDIGDSQLRTRVK
jgi:long-chain acyl-CoA synthetase